MTTTTKRLIRLERTKMMLQIQLGETEAEIAELMTSEEVSPTEADFITQLEAVDLTRAHLAWIASIEKSS